MGADDQGTGQVSERWHAIPRALAFITHGGDLLLIKHPPDKRVYPDRYNGIGGHIERGEDVLTAARREILEETGLTIRDLRLCGICNIDAGGSTGVILFVFRAEAESRAVVASAEGTPEWVPIAEVYGRDLVEDLPVILPRVLQSRPGDPPFFAHYGYDEGDRLVISFPND
jgi:8-oxo-dGTP diphosphatase